MGKDLYTEQCAAAKAYNTIYHYTTLDALKLILESDSLRLSRLDKVNDPLENTRIIGLWNKKIYVACFTHSQSNQNHFIEQYKSNVRIDFTPKNFLDKAYFDRECTELLKSVKEYNYRSDLSHGKYENNYDWCMYDYSFFNVHYTDDLKKHTNKGITLNAGMIKLQHGIDIKNEERNWSMEEETRIRITVRPIGFEAYLKENEIRYWKPPFEYIYVPIKNCISGIHILENCSNNERLKFQEIINLYCRNNKIDISGF